MGKRWQSFHFCIIKCITSTALFLSLKDGLLSERNPYPRHIIKGKRKRAAANTYRLYSHVRVPVSYLFSNTHYVHTKQYVVVKTVMSVRVSLLFSQELISKCLNDLFFSFYLQYQIFSKLKCYTHFVVVFGIAKRNR